MLEIDLKTHRISNFLHQIFPIDHSINPPKGGGGPGAPPAGIRPPFLNGQRY